MSWLLFGLFAVILYQEHKKDRHQNHILYLGTVCCIMNAFEFNTGAPQKALGRYLPVYIWCAAALSALFHRCVIGRSDQSLCLSAYETRNEKKLVADFNNTTADSEMARGVKK